MKKPHKYSVIPDKAGINGRADDLLAEIRDNKQAINKITERLNSAMKEAVDAFEIEHKPLKDALIAHEKALIALMKKERIAFFGEMDVLQLANGVLIHVMGDRVMIPRDALAKCEELKFDDVIKVVKSLNREAIEKWPDEKLFLIGAERKAVENFSYDLKKEGL